MAGQIQSTSPPVPFEDLDSAVERGPGRPHLSAAANAMDKAENLTAAMIIAPFAGIAAAVGKFYKYGKSGQSDNQGRV